MNHKEITRLLGAYVDGELSGERKKAVEEHLKTCAECAHELECIKRLNEMVRGEKISLPPDAYWDAFAGRVMERAREEHKRSFFSVWIPRMKWELAGGIVLLLLTFVVSKQVLMKRSTEEISIDGKRFIGIEKAAPEGGFFAKDMDETSKTPGEGKTMDRIEEKETAHGIAKKAVDKEHLDFAGKKSGLSEKELEISSIMKGAEERDVAVREEEAAGSGEVSETGALSEPAPPAANEEAILFESKKAPATKAEEEGLGGVKDSEDDYLRVAQVSERSQIARRDFLRLLYDQAEKTRKRVDIERAIKEIEFYQDSYPEDFQDTLVIFSDSLQQMIDEVERQEAEQAPADEKETE
jgi:TolA-binding protein